MTGPQKPRIACIGEVMIELIMGEGANATLNVAGDTYNTAVYLSRLLGPDWGSVSYITALGTDAFSERVMAHMASEGIETHHVERREDRTVGLYAIETDAAGERSFTYWRSQSAARTLFQEPCAIGTSVFEDYDLIFLSGITLAVLPPESRAHLMDGLRAFRSKGGQVAYDSNHRPRLWEDVDTAREVNRLMWAQTDVPLPSVDDEMLIHGDADETAATARLRGYGLASGALKRGEKGPLALSGAQAAADFPPANSVVDTTAAGDSFNAGFLYQHAIGGSEAEALSTGHAIASQVIGAKGAIVPVSLPNGK